MNWPTPSGRIVIAGGTGILGTHLAGRLADLGCEVVVFGRHDVPRRLLDEGFEFKLPDLDSALADLYRK